MSTLFPDVAFDFTLADSPASLDRPLTPPQDFPLPQHYFFDSSLQLPHHAVEYPHHVRSSSIASSIYSAVSAAESNADPVCTRMTPPPPRASPLIRHHGPLLLPKIRPQDQQAAVGTAADPVGPRLRVMAPLSQPKVITKRRSKRSCRARSQTNLEAVSNMTASNFIPLAHPATQEQQTSVTCSSMSFPEDLTPRRPSTCPALDPPVLDGHAFPSYHAMAFAPPGTDNYSMVRQDYGYQSFAARATPPMSMPSTPEPTPLLSLLSFLTSPSPAASLVRTISYPIRDPNTKHFWWDVRNLRKWSDFDMSAVMNLPGASAVLTTPVPASLLPEPVFPARHPETEASLHAIYASYYLPKLNAALAVAASSSSATAFSPGNHRHRPLQLSVPERLPAGTNEPLFVGSMAGDASAAATLFGGKPTARVVGIVRSFERFNTGMRAEGAVKRVEYLGGLAAVHHAMREHSCRYGFILTEIELVLVRNGIDATPNFGELDVASVSLSSAATTPPPPPSSGFSPPSSPPAPPLTACLALWGLCRVASATDPADAAAAGHAYYRTEIGAPVEGTRRKVLVRRDEWIPMPQLAEKRAAKRARGWIWPEEAVGRRELGRRGVKYGSI